MSVAPDLNPPWNELFAHRMEGVTPSEIRGFLKLLSDPTIISLAGGIPDPDLFPYELFNDAWHRIMFNRDLRAKALQYAESEGYTPLRQWIADYVTRRGTPCAPENILITSGSQASLDLLAKVFINPGDTVLTQLPTYLGALQAFNVYQPTYDTIDRESWNSTKLAYVVADFANPSGESLSRTTREALLSKATAAGVPIVEDVAYEALRYDGEPEQSLLAIDTAKTGSIEQSRVIQVGTFSKTISPGLRVGWVCAPTSVIEKLVLTRQAADLHSSILDQMLVHHVVTNGFDAQVQKLLPVYRARRDVMIRTLHDVMPEGVRWSEPAGGMFVWLQLPDGVQAHKLLNEALHTHKVIFVPGPSFFPNGQGAQFARINFSRSDEATIQTGLQRLGAALEAVKGDR